MKKTFEKIELSQRPRERLINTGIKSLNNYELLAIILKSGTKKEDVMELSKKILDDARGLSNLAKYSYDDLIKIHGIKKAKAASILAAIELGKRSIIINKNTNIKVSSYEYIYKLIYPNVANLDNEEMWIVYLNLNSEIISYEKLYEGNLSKIYLDIQTIIKKTILKNAKGIIIIHNHPSGNSSPSQTDIITTKNINNACNLLNIKLIEHLIIGNDEYFQILKMQKKYIN